MEANECIGDRDFKMKIKACGRESKESANGPRPVITGGLGEQENESAYLHLEAK